MLPLKLCPVARATEVATSLALRRANVGEAPRATEAITRTAWRAIIKNSRLSQESGAMLEAPILVVLIIAAIVAVLWWVYR
jgi:hypothetical protein